MDGLQPHHSNSMANMSSAAKGNRDSYVNELLRAHPHVCNQMLGFVNSASIKCAIQLQIPDLIHEHGRPMTLPELVRASGVKPEKSHGLFHLMRFLVHSGFFEIELPEGGGEPAYSLNRSSQLLLRDNEFSMLPLVRLTLFPSTMSPCDQLGDWLLNDKPTAFGTAFGFEYWEGIPHDSSWNDSFNEGMASDARLISSVLVNGVGREVFEGINSLVDVGGGTGALAREIADAFPEIECTVLDLLHVVDGLEGHNNLKYVPGDMFKEVPPADAVLLKWILHNWGDDECVKILKRCKESITQKNKKGMVMIIDIVVEDVQGSGSEKRTETQLCYDILMMALFSGGKERTEKEWAKLFGDAGFSRYEVSPLDLGLKSLIQVYP